MTPPLGTPVPPPLGGVDAESPPPRIGSANFLVGLCVLGGAWALLAVAARVLFGWRWGR